MKRLVEAFENFILTEAKDSKRLPTMFDALNWMMNDDGFRLVGRYNVQSSEGRAVLFTYRHDIGGFPLAFIMYGDNSMYVIWDHAIATMDAKERQNRRNRRSSRNAAVDYYVKTYLSPFIENHELPNGASFDLTAINPTPVKFDYMGRDIRTEPPGWKFYHGPNKRLKSADHVLDFPAENTTVGAILKNLFGNMDQVYVVKQPYDFKSYIPFTATQADLDKLEYYKKFIESGFVRAGTDGIDGEYMLSGSIFKDNYVYLLLPVDSVEWFNPKTKKQIYLPEENGVACVRVSMEGRLWVNCLDTDDNLSFQLSRKRNKYGTFMSAEDWNMAFQTAWEWFDATSKEYSNDFAIHGANSQMTRDDLRINNGLTDAIDELW